MNASEQKIEKIENNGKWYFVSVVLQCIEGPASRRSVTWENHHLIKADSIREAYDKAIELESSYVSTTNKGSSDKWTVSGVSELLEIYEDIEDGCEIFWTDHGKLRPSRIKKMVKSLEFWNKVRGESKEQGQP